ncbi:MAG: hypothetical protein IJB86_06480 [Clostridia bacterium]|nr:hypothetical protein [Clostridia bacterium]
MNSTFFWNEFLKSGKISDYLQYRQHLSFESAKEDAVLEEKYASEHRRIGDNREYNGRE